MANSQQLEQQLIDPLWLIILHPMAGAWQAFHARIRHTHPRRSRQFLTEIRVAHAPDHQHRLVDASQPPYGAPTVSDKGAIVVDPGCQRPASRDGLDVLLNVILTERAAAKGIAHK